MSEIKVIDLSDSINSMRQKVNENFGALNDAVVLNADSVALLSDNYYVADLTKGLLSAKNATINGSAYITFGSDKVSFKNGRVKVISNHSIDDIAEQKGMIYTLSSSAAVIDLTLDSILQNIDENEFITIRIADTDAIYGFVKVSLVGYQDDKYMELSPERPSITLQKVHDSGIARFLLIAYPDVTDIESSEGDILYYILEKVLAIENSIKEIKEQISEIDLLRWKEI